MSPVALSPEHLQAAAAEAERLARHLPTAAFKVAAERMRRRADAVAAGATLDDLALAGDPIALFCVTGRAT